MVVKALTVNKKRYSGRSSHTGSILMYGRGGGVKRRYRLIDFTRLLLDVPAKILRFEYDPARRCVISLVCYRNGFLAYILSPENLGVNSRFIVTLQKPRYFFFGSSYLLKFLPTGCFVFNIETALHKGAQYIRAAGCFGKLLCHYMQYCLIRLPSGVNKVFLNESLGTLGRLTSVVHARALTRNGLKAGVLRRLGFRPVVRGVARNSVDHPNGGNTAGGSPAEDRWGNLAKGVPTRLRRRHRSAVEIRLGKANLK